MKSTLALASILLVAAPFMSQEQKPALGLPELHTIKTVTLSPSYTLF